MDSGVYSWSTLISQGATRYQIDRAVADGDLVRVRHGWYARRTADPDVVAAVATGGVMSCVSALRRSGIWVPEHHGAPHVRGNAPAYRNISERLCRPYGRFVPEAGPVDDVATAFRHAVRCLDDEGLVVVADSILNQGALSLDDLRQALHGSPLRIRSLLDRCDPRAESGPETMVRLRLRARGIPVRVQVWIWRVGRVDLLVGEKLILEIDSVAFHTGHERYESDRARDRRAVAQGLIAMRLTYRNVVHEWDAVYEEIAAIVRGRRHRAARHR
ncbi:hypothetical protein [Gordonia soli]|uniref:DUF559 domain-containing protein n=1 Tax=Gordonia soli NBRC 108243 TaxID=1223545 RepID=M0QKV6_9ACTN|nr:hypothetical protein [Gordonia soli]GAC68057.1 hypothetical protein GS4_11_03290 [Gordonia soli NBRC 108243]